MTRARRSSCSGRPAAVFATLLGLGVGIGAPRLASAQDPPAAPQAPASGATPPTDAARADEASQRFKSGVSFYKDRDFTAALADFKRAYELSPNWIVLYNLGQTARELHDHASALKSYEQYLKDGGARVSASRKKEVLTAIDELRAKVGHVRVTTPVDGAEIAIDDVVVGVTPLASAATVNAGRRKISATASGYTPVQRMVDVASMEDTNVSLDLVKVGGQVVVVQPPPATSADRGPTLGVGFWAAAGATAAVGIGTAITGAVALSAHASLKTALATYPGNPTTIANDQSKTKSLAIATDVLGVLTLAGAAATVVVFVVLPRTQSKTTVGLTPGGLSVSGSF